MTQIATESGPDARGRSSASRCWWGRASAWSSSSTSASFPHRDVELLSVPREGKPDGLGSKAYEGPLMQFRVGRRRPDPASVPATLRELPEWVDEIPATPQKTWTVGIDGFRWVINGRGLRPLLRRALAGDRHHRALAPGERHVGRPPRPPPPHRLLHARAKRPAPAALGALPQGDLLPRPGRQVEVGGHFSDHLGKFVVHCHMLDHEDHGLMSQFEVVPPAP